MRLSDTVAVNFGESFFAPGKAWLNVTQGPYVMEVRLTPSQLMRLSARFQRLAFKLSEKKRGKR